MEEDRGANTPHDTKPHNYDKPPGIPWAMPLAFAALAGNVILASWMYLSETGPAGRRTVEKLWLDNAALAVEVKIYGYKLDRMREDIIGSLPSARPESASWGGAVSAQ
jgi:hypothetical protein